MDWDAVGRIQDYIDRQVDRRQSNKVLHGHPSPTFWLERRVPVADLMAERRRTYRVVPKRLNVYVGTPYCLPTEPDRCGFCLFPSEVYQGRHQLDQYLDYLRREAVMYRESLADDRVANVYFGGGTSNLYKADHYATLLDIVRGVLPRLGADAEITLEGIPQLFTREKLQAMQQAGINRISMGVQQLDDELIKLSGRKQSAAHVFRVIEWCAELALPLSVDLIFGWPRQTIAHMLADLGRVVDAKVPHITHYELNVAGRTDFSRNRRHELPSTRQNLEMYRVGKAFLESYGYRQATAYDWEWAGGGHSAAYRYEEAWRQPFVVDEVSQLSGYDAWGLGFAGISFLLGTGEKPGWAFMNCTHVDDYFRRLDAGEIPVERGFHYTPMDLRLTTLFQMLQGMRVDRRVYRTLFSLDPVEEHAATWRALTERRWAEISPEAITLVGDGVFFTPLIQGVLAQTRMDEMRRKSARLPGSAAEVA